ncbi:MAG: UDP-3-O-(3-hydroxymyristoyl)glucosamine N-acyltransferase [Burkholderiaceae bacterium]|nr:UDP-3-O-(3-hydroxymyristoyl)glucosamine N-acyltransferase [Burkholderiaceae bacterium]
MARSLPHPVALRALVERFGGVVQPEGADPPIVRLAPLASARSGDLSFLAAPRHRASAGGTHASAVIVSAELSPALAPDVVRVVVDDPLAHFGRVARWFEHVMEGDAPQPGIDPSASVSPRAVLGAGVRIGAHCVIEDGVVVGDDCSIGAHTTLARGVRVGAASVVHANVSVYRDCTLGARCIVHSGTVIGSDGFGFAREHGRWSKIPQLGTVVIGDDVEIGANCAIDRGALEDTVIGDGCKLDNLIQIAHNVRIGEHSALAGCVGVAGSAVIGRRCMIGGGAGILGHLEICDDVVVSAMSLVTRSISEPGFYSGVFPLMPNARWERSATIVRRLPELRDRVRTLEQAVRGAPMDSSDEQGED